MESCSPLLGTDILTDPSYHTSAFVANNRRFYHIICPEIRRTRKDGEDNPAHAQALGLWCLRLLVVGWTEMDFRAGLLYDLRLEVLLFDEDGLTL